MFTSKSNLTLAKNVPGLVAQLVERLAVSNYKHSLAVYQKAIGSIPIRTDFLLKHF